MLKGCEDGARAGHQGHQRTEQRVPAAPALQQGAGDGAASRAGLAPVLCQAEAGRDRGRRQGRQALRQQPHVRTAHRQCVLPFLPPLVSRIQQAARTLPSSSLGPRPSHNMRYSAACMQHTCYHAWKWQVPQKGLSEGLLGMRAQTTPSRSARSPCSAAASPSRRGAPSSCRPWTSPPPPSAPSPRRPVGPLAAACKHPSKTHQAPLCAPDVHGP